RCPDRQTGDSLTRSAHAKTGLASLDAAAALASNLQTDSKEAMKDRAAPLPHLAQLRSFEGAEAIVRGALVSGRISSALNWFHELKQVDGGSGSVFSEFRAIAGRLAYELVCNQQLDFLFVAMHMLRNVGESVNRFFK
ncbi:unnamed protein product, partial [Polarella glacialis]